MVTFHAGQGWRELFPNSENGMLKLPVVSKTSEEISGLLLKC